MIAFDVKYMSSLLSIELSRMFVSHVFGELINSHLQIAIKFSSYNSVESRNQIFPFVVRPFQIFPLRVFRFLGFHDRFPVFIRDSFFFIISTPLLQINAFYFQWIMKRIIHAATLFYSLAKDDRLP